MATGRSDTRTRSNKRPCVPYIFRGALEGGADDDSTIAMEVAAVVAIAELAQAEQSEVGAAAYAGANLSASTRQPAPEAVRPRA